MNVWAIVAVSGSCFAAGTPVRTPAGHCPVQDVRVGQLVLTRAEGDPDGPVLEAIVTETFSRLQATLTLRIEGRDVRATAEHPFWVEGRGWTPAGAVEPGDRLRAERGPALAVEAVTPGAAVVPVYNLRVAEYHTYFVGEAGWGFAAWAHNANACGTAVKQDANGRWHDAQGRFAPAPNSPALTGDELAGKTRTQIRDLANQKGLVPAGDTTHPDFPRNWTDPVTGNEMVRLDRGHFDQATGQPYNNPNAAVDHVHGYGPDGTTKLKVNNDPHIPTIGE